MATLLPTTDRDEGIDDAYKSSLRFLRRYNKRIDIDLTKPDALTAIGEIWDQIGDIDFRDLLTGTVKTSLSDEYVSLLVYAVVNAQLQQYLTTLPLPVAPNISVGGQA